MSLILIAAALLSASAPPAVAPATLPKARAVDRSRSDQTRLAELEIAIRSAQEKGEIDRATALEFRRQVARLRRQLIRMGIQVGYRQRVRMRQRIDALEARIAARRGVPGQGRSGK
jgi:hypothetical protein